MRGIDEAVIVYGPAFSIFSFNPRAEEMFSVPAASLVGRPFSLDFAKDPAFATLLPVMYPSLAPTVARLTDPGADPQRAKIILDDPVREFLSSTYVVPNGFVKVVREVTREESLVKSKGDFVTIAAHQLRTPATAVNWTFENLEKDAHLPDSARDDVRTGHAAAQNLLSVITHLLDAAQIEDGRFGYSFAKTDIVAFFDTLLSSALSVARHYGVNLYFESPPQGSLFVMMDPAKFGLAAANLVDNAVKYNARGGQVIVGIASEGASVHVTVADTGQGIGPEDVPKLFGKFFRAGSASSQVTEGSGLGLYLAKNVVEGHRGKIWAESVPGRGSTFHIVLPIAPSSPS
jgi:signal transduction histidine kinase